MKPPDSNAARPVRRSTGGLRRILRLVAGGRPRVRPDGLAALLLPMVRRVLRTGRGPTALVRWVRRATAARPPSDQLDPIARELTGRLVRLLLAPSDPLADTLADG